MRYLAEKGKRGEKMKRKILGFALFLMLLAGISYLMGAGNVPTQPPVNVDSAVESDWDQYIEYTIDLAASESIMVAIGGIDTLRIVHLVSVDTNSSGIYYPLEGYMHGAAGVHLGFGNFTEFLIIGLGIATTDSLFLKNPDTTTAIGVKVSLIGE